MNEFWLGDVALTWTGLLSRILPDIRVRIPVKHLGGDSSAEQDTPGHSHARDTERTTSTGRLLITCPGSEAEVASLFSPSPYGRASGMGQQGHRGPGPHPWPNPDRTPPANCRSTGAALTLTEPGGPSPRSALSPAPRRHQISVQPIYIF